MLDNAVPLYRQAGGTLTEDYSFGFDPLASNPRLVQQREEEFLRENPSFDEIYNNVVNGNGFLFQQALLSFLHKTVSLSV